MANPLNRGTGNGNGFMQNVMQMVNMARGGGNPQMFINQLAQKNPQAAQQINELLKSGQTPQDAALGLMRQRGIDPTQITNMLGYNGQFGRR